MTFTDDRRFPAALSAVARVEFDYRDGLGVDYEPYDRFNTAEEEAFWFRLWTGNTELTGDRLRVFGQDGSGGYVAFWIARPDAPLVEQPVVFFGSEGGVWVVARDLGRYLWLLAEGYGPLEAPDPDGTGGAGDTDGTECEPVRNEEAARIAEEFAPGRELPAAEIVREARAEFPDFEEVIEALCR
ncbi:SMI1/KNR4 family protein [Streptomyces sp. UNOC14_S4]|uniref:SMI1/KNR4 family protein n=1 Tax=Streptomyces sp. UNOC14_S4 TaxID=2872340 RepID=UPI001E28CC4B|nr:SMI1/KNR4 family protein [Streptomyces sp. UNOC14_S4]MCC3772834.1 SMI1/KNR4 family protein [Streptomyces sp. UNOC14_S4]